MTAYHGGCECGAVRYRMASDPLFVNCCHCRQCQKLSGSAFAMNAMIERERIDVIEGAEALSDGRCSSCGTLLWGTHPMFGDNVLFLRVGTLDEGEQMTPNAHFFVRSKHPWVALPADLPAFETLPMEGDAPLITGEAAERLEAARTADLPG